MNESHYQKLKVWQKARRLTKEVYVATRQFPRDEIFGLTQQMLPCGHLDRLQHR